MFIDILFIIIAITGFFAGYMKGLIATVINVLAIVIAVLAAAKFSPWLIDLLEGVLPKIDPRIYLILGFILTFIVFMAGIKWLGKNLERGLKGIHLNQMNKMAGGLLYLILNSIIFSTALWILKDFSIFSPDKYTDSYTYPTLEKIPMVTGEYLQSIKPLFQEFWDKLTHIAHELKQSGQK